MAGLLALSRFIDRANEIIGKIVAWAILVSILISSGNAIIRKAFNMSSNAWLELQWYLFGLAWLLAAAYTLKQNEHIRIDIVYGMVSRRRQHWIDLLGHIFFLMPFTLLMIYYFVPYFLRSFHSAASTRPAPAASSSGRRSSSTATSGGFCAARRAGHFGDHQEDRRHARRHGRPTPLRLGAMNPPNWKPRRLPRRHRSLPRPRAKSLARPPGVR